MNDKEKLFSYYKYALQMLETEINIFKESNPVVENNQVNKTTEYISCPKCGARIKSDAKLCFLCGRRLD